VQESPARLRYLDALQVSLEADANLLFGSTDLPFTPSKILAVLATGRPVLALAPSGSALVTRLAQLGQPCVIFPAAGSASTASGEAALQLHNLAAGRTGTADLAALNRHNAEAIAARQLSVLQTVATG